jgi:ABC-type cobalamin/Fe3+-siderophores transport system ATPase subunit
MLRLDSLSFASRGQKILSDVTTVIPDSALTCLIGANGAGKTTLLRVLLGELRAGSGTFYIDNTRASALSPKRIATYLAIIPQGIQPPPDFTVSELVTLGWSPPNRAFWWRLSAQERGSVQECITRCDVSQFSERRVEELSGGEQRRAWLAFALAQRKRYLLLDETLDGLDVLAKQSFFKLLKEVASEGKGILLTTHDLDLVTHFADKVVVLSGGRVNYEGPPIPNLQDLLLPASA